MCFVTSIRRGTQRPTDSEAHGRPKWRIVTVSLCQLNIQQVRISLTSFLRSTCLKPVSTCPGYTVQCPVRYWNHMWFTYQRHHEAKRFSPNSNQRSPPAWTVDGCLTSNTLPRPSANFRRQSRHHVSLCLSQLGRSWAFLCTNLSHVPASQRRPSLVKFMSNPVGSLKFTFLFLTQVETMQALVYLLSVILNHC